MGDFELDETALPMANAKNKQIEELVRQKDKDVYSLETQIKEISSRIEGMSDHMKNVQQELKLTQNLVSAREHEIESENHLRMIGENRILRILMMHPSKSQ